MADDVTTRRGAHVTTPSRDQAGGSGSRVTRLSVGWSRRWAHEPAPRSSSCSARRSCWSSGPWRRSSPRSARVDPTAELRRIRAGELTPADLADSLSPSLFAEARVDRAAGRARGGQGPDRGDPRAGRRSRPRAWCWWCSTPAGPATRRWPTPCARRRPPSPRATRSPATRSGPTSCAARRGGPAARSRRPRSAVLIEAVGSDLRELAAATGAAGRRHRRHRRRAGGAPLPPGPRRGDRVRGGRQGGGRRPGRRAGGAALGAAARACRRCWSPTRWPTRCAPWPRSARPAVATPTGWPACSACRRGRSARRSRRCAHWRPGVAGRRVRRRRRGQRRRQGRGRRRRLRAANARCCGSAPPASPADRIRSAAQRARHDAGIPGTPKRRRRRVPGRRRRDRGFRRGYRRRWTRLAMADLRLAAWFLWMTPLLAALSSALEAARCSVGGLLGVAGLRGLAEAADRGARRPSAPTCCAAGASRWS